MKRRKPRGSTITITMPKEISGLVYPSEECRGEWIVHSTFFAKNIETGKPDSFGLRRTFKRKPTKGQISAVFEDHVAHEIQEQLGMKPHRSAR